MKRVIFTIFTVLVFSAVSYSQDFHGGVLFGVSGTEISGDRLSGPNKAGLYLGGFVNRYFGEKSSLQMELDYIQKGSRKNPDSTSYDSYLLRLSYIEIPVHYRYDFIERASLEVGLSLGVLINSYEEVNTIDGQYGPDFEPFDLSFNFGLFYALTKKMKINVRYTNSILAVRPHSNGQTYKWNRGQYNEVLSFILFYQFN
jgi:hypothetical protein